MRTVPTIVVLLLTAVAGAPLLAQEAPRAHAELVDRDGRSVGHVALTETPYHGVHVRLTAEGLPPGTHAFHIHETGRCEAPDFSSAGGHYAPRGHDHGVLHAHGKHAGDLLNVHVPESGHLDVERLATAVTLRPGLPSSLFDEDGSAFVVHAGPDDYRSQPSGAAGDRIACGVIER